MMRPHTTLVTAAVVLFGLSPILGRAEEIKYITSPATGKVLVISVDENPPITLPGHPLPPEDGGGAPALRAPEPTATPKTLSQVKLTAARNPVEASKNFLNAYGQAFGLKDPASELRVSKSKKDSLGMTHVRFSQRYGKIPVFAAELVTHVGSDIKVKSVNGAVGSQVSLDTKPRIRMPQAVRLAKLYFFREHRRAATEVREPELKVYQPALIGNTNDSSSYLVWEASVRAPVGNKTYLIDAMTGALRFVLDNMRYINRKVYDCSAKLGAGGLCWSNYLETWNGQYGWGFLPPENYLFGCRDVNQPNQCPHGPNPRYLPEISSDTDTLYDMLSDIHEYYWVKFNRDGANGLGGNNDGSQAPLITVDMDAGQTYLDFLSGWPQNCPDAAYDPAVGTIFCRYTVVNDVVGHEYAHGVDTTENYSGESGALEENHSDIIGEMFEYWLTGDNDWVFAASVAGAVVRNLADPPSIFNPFIGQYFPDRFYSSYFYCGSLGQGGVHHNSTVPSKGLYLATMGGDFNGCTVSGIGRGKVEQIIHRAKTVYYAGTETFNGAYEHLIQSCIDLYGAGSQDCRNIAKALQAVELNQMGRCADPSGAQSYPATCRCEDSDDWRGQGNFSQQGMSAGSVTFQGEVFQDYCVMRMNLVEQYCKFGARRQALIECPNGCSNGVCS